MRRGTNDCCNNSGVTAVQQYSSEERNTLSTYFTMPNDADACVPTALTDFVFDLYDSVTLSQLTEEQSRLYNTEFRELSAKVCNVGSEICEIGLFPSFLMRIITNLNCIRFFLF
jgi:hypothetical protein